MSSRLRSSAIALLAPLAVLAADRPVPVTAGNFVRAESDLYFGRYVKRGALGKFVHERRMTPIDKQEVVRMNRDTLYSLAVFDLDAGPVAIELPDTGKRFMSMQVISQDHYTIEVAYAPGTFRYTREKVGTRYVFIGVRTLANPEDAADLKAAQGAQDRIRVEQAGVGHFEVPRWDSKSRDKARAAIESLASLGPVPGVGFGTKEEVDPVRHLISTAVGWGGNPPSAAVYVSAYPKANDGKTAYKLTLKDVPVDGFWSISVYNAKGFFEKNSRGAYSVNNLTAKPDADGSVTVRFGGCGKGAPNCLPIVAGWNYTARLYRPRKEVLDGSWKFPEAEVVQ
jgi:para-nitrobenzyl esterase